MVMDPPGDLWLPLQGVLKVCRSAIFLTYCPLGKHSRTQSEQPLSRACYLSSCLKAGLPCQVHVSSMGRLDVDF